MRQVKVLDTQQGDIVMLGEAWENKIGTDVKVPVEVTYHHVFQDGCKESTYIEMRSAKYLQSM